MNPNILQNRLLPVVLALSLVFSAPLKAQVEQVKPTAQALSEFQDERNILKKQDVLKDIGMGSTAIPSDSDHKAKIYNISGDVRVLKKGTGLWLPAQKWMSFEAGDKFRTGPDSYIELVYDDAYLNIARIDEKTLGEFRSIEPTDLFLSDGSVFNALDGLKNSYQISTPVAVAAVRGTHFDVSYIAATGDFNVATFSVPDDGHVSEIFVEEMNASGEKGNSAIVTEGSGLSFNSEQGLEAGETKMIEGSNLEKSQEIIGRIPSQAQNKRRQAMSELLGGNVQPLPKDNSDEQKIVQKPNDGNPPSGGGSGPSMGDSGMMNRTPAISQNKMDGFIDKALQTHDKAPVMVNPSLAAPAVTDLRNAEKGIKQSKPSTTNAPVDMGKTMEFAQVGGMKVQNQQDVQQLQNLMKTMGAPAERVDTMAQRMNERITEMEKQFTTNVMPTNTGLASPTAADMPSPDTSAMRMEPMTTVADMPPPDMSSMMISGTEMEMRTDMTSMMGPEMEMPTMEMDASMYQNVMTDIGMTTTDAMMPDSSMYQDMYRDQIMDNLIDPTTFMPETETDISRYVVNLDFLRSAIQNYLNNYYPTSSDSISSFTFYDYDVDGNGIPDTVTVNTIQSADGYDIAETINVQQDAGETVIIDKVENVRTTPTESEITQI